MFKIANVGARQATLSDIACQPTWALVAETKLLVYNDNCCGDADAVENGVDNNDDVHPFSDGPALVDVHQVEDHPDVFLCYLPTPLLSQS